MLLPRAYGGEEVDHVTWFRAMEALAKLDASTAWCVGQINGCAVAAASVAPQVARRIWGEPRAALSWGPPVRSRADEVEGGHRLSGEWMMSSGSRHATWIGLMAPVFDSSGAPVTLSGGATLRIFLVPASQVEWIENWDVIGLVATITSVFVAVVLRTFPFTWPPTAWYSGVGFVGVAVTTAIAIRSEEHTSELQSQR